MSKSSDPPRLAEIARSSELGQLMASATRDVPSDEELASLARGLGAVLQSPQGAPSPHGTSILVKLGVTTGFAALIAGGVLASQRQSARQGVQTSASSLARPAAGRMSTALVTSTPVRGPAVDNVTAPSASSARSLSPTAKKIRTDPVQSGASAPDGLSEPALLEQARRVLASAPAAALALTNEHAQRFPRGLLVQEREVIAIEALRRLYRTAEADRRAAAFSKAFPGSAHLRMVEDAPPK
jgi:hypothetical protein